MLARSAWILALALGAALATDASAAARAHAKKPVKHEALKQEAQPQPEPPRPAPPACLEDSCLGIHTGMTFSRITHSTSNAPRAGFLIGVDAEVPLSETFALVEELTFTQRGGKDFRGVAGNDVRVDELELPVLLKVRFPTTVPTGRFIPYLKFGPSVAAIAGSNTQTLEGRATTDSFSATDVSVRFGFGASFPLFHGSENALDFGLQYVIGLKNLVALAPEKSTSRALVINVGYQFPF